MLAQLAEIPTIVWVILIGGFFIFMLFRSMARMAAENPDLLNPPMPRFGSEFDGPDFSGLTFHDVQRADDLNTRGIHLAGQGLLEESEQAFRAAIRIAPRLPHYRVSLSNVLLMQNRVTEAERELQAANQLNPDPQTAQAIYVNMAGVRNEQKRFRECLNWLEQASLVYQPDHEVYFNMGVAHEQLGEWEEAQMAFAASDRVMPNQPARQSLIRARTQVWRSPAVEEIRADYRGFELEFPTCGAASLPPEQMTSHIEAGTPLVFLAGAGLSYPRPAALPLVNTILRELFHFFEALDHTEICAAFDIEAGTSEQDTYAHLCRQLLNLPDSIARERCSLPFEPTFQVLHDMYSAPVLRFVDLLNRGSHNLHHVMLAYALKQGHTVVTTNFDQHIELAYMALFGILPTTLVKDSEFQQALDRGQMNGVLAKLHGDLDDYNSLALTLEGVASHTDRTIMLGDDIEPEHGMTQLRRVYPKTALSIPKALFLQQVVEQKKIVVMGYSGSDEFDIMPILTTREFGCRGVWVEHSSGVSSPPVAEWQAAANERVILKPADDEQTRDLSAEVSRYFLSDFGGEWEAADDTLPDRAALADAFSAWIDRLRIRRGDGLSFIARLHSQRGRWDTAERFYRTALATYAKDMEHNEGRWLAVKSNISYVLGYREENDAAFEIKREVQQYIETQDKEDLYINLYPSLLLDIVARLANTDQDNEAARLFEKAMQLARQNKDRRTLNYGIRVAADRYWGKGDYAQARESYLGAAQMAITAFGDLREACLASIGAGMSSAMLGDRYEAARLLNLAEQYARHLGDEQLIEAAQGNQAYASSRFAGQPATTPKRSQDFHTDLIENAKKGSGNPGEIEDILEYVGYQNYEFALRRLDELEQHCKHPDVLAFVYFIKSNIFVRMGDWVKDVEMLEAFGRIRPDEPMAEQNFGVAYSSLGDYERAECHYLRAIELMDGQYPLAVCNLGVLYTNMGRLDDARTQLERAEAQGAPENPLETLRGKIMRLERSNGV